MLRYTPTTQLFTGLRALQVHFRVCPPNMGSQGQISSTSNYSRLRHYTSSDNSLSMPPNMGSPSPFDAIQSEFEQSALYLEYFNTISWSKFRATHTGMYMPISASSSSRAKCHVQVKNIGWWLCRFTNSIAIYSTIVATRSCIDFASSFAWLVSVGHRLEP